MITDQQRRERKLAGTALAFVVAVAAGLFLMATIKRPLDPDTLCPLDGQYARTAVLVDATDSLSISQHTAITAAVLALPRRLEMFEQVSVYVLDAEKLLLPEPAIALCYPGDRGTANLLIENPEEVQRRFEEGFKMPLIQAIDAVAATPPHPTSPIHEMLRAVAMTREFDASQPRRLLIVSDLLQHTPPGYSHYTDSVSSPIGAAPPTGGVFRTTTWKA